MRKKVFLKGPVMSQSGYGHHARTVAKALKQREDIFDVYIENINWGRTGWQWEDSPFRRWVDDKIRKAATYSVERDGPLDISLQVTIPNEWQKIAQVNIGVTAGIETTKVSGEWISKGSVMDKIIVVSNHAKQTYEKTVVKAQTPDGKVFDYSIKTPIEVVNYPVIDCDTLEIAGFNPDTDFNFLCVSQWGPRKNFNNTISWWVEEFKNENVGLIIKTNHINNCILDHSHTSNALKNLLNNYPDRKCKVYLLHGDLKREQMSWLYQQKNVKALLNIAHGEGFGLPMFEAAQASLPVVTIGWSGQLDFLVHDGKKYFAEVDYTIQPVQKESVWNGVIEGDSMWAFADKTSYQKRIRDVFEQHAKYKRTSKKLQKIVSEKFAEEKINKQFVKHVFDEEVFEIESWLMQVGTESEEEIVEHD